MTDVAGRTIPNPPPPPPESTGWSALRRTATGQQNGSGVGDAMAGRLLNSWATGIDRVYAVAHGDADVLPRSEV